MSSIIYASSLTDVQPTPQPMDPEVIPSLSTDFSRPPEGLAAAAAAAGADADAGQRT